MEDSNSTPRAQQDGLADERRSLTIQRQIAERFTQFREDHESQSQALNRLMDEAGVPEVLQCAGCGGPIRGRYVGLKDADRAYHVDCADLSLEDE